jgi:uncharacterized RDD family membrane protein YckC
LLTVWHPRAGVRVRAARRHGGGGLGRLGRAEELRSEIEKVLAGLVDYARQFATIADLALVAAARAVRMIGSDPSDAGPAEPAHRVWGIRRQHAALTRAIVGLQLIVPVLYPYASRRCAVVAANGRHAGWATPTSTLPSTGRTRLGYAPPVREKPAEDYLYDVCLSFAGEQRPYVQNVADGLRERGLRIFYDQYEQSTLWGKDLYVHLDRVYREDARFCVLFASSAYAGKVWTNHERRSAQARALIENVEYILPARFDDTEIPGLPATVGYVDLRQTAPERLAALIVQKVAFASGDFASTGAGERSRYSAHQQVGAFAVNKISSTLSTGPIPSPGSAPAARGQVLDATGWQRLGARAFDLFLAFLLLWPCAALAWSIGWVVDFAISEINPGFEARIPWLPILEGLTAFLIVVVVECVSLVHLRGRTLGKGFAGVRVVRCRGEGANLTYRIALLRTAAYVLFTYSPAMLISVPLVLSGDRGLHDRLAGTRVVQAEEWTTAGGVAAARRTFSRIRRRRIPSRAP